MFRSFPVLLAFACVCGTGAAPRWDAASSPSPPPCDCSKGQCNWRKLQFLPFKHTISQHRFVLSQKEYESNESDVHQRGNPRQLFSKLYTHRGVAAEHIRILWLFGSSGEMGSLESWEVTLAFLTFARFIFSLLTSANSCPGTLPTKMKQTWMMNLSTIIMPCNNTGCK
jgi:hypothetical protein